MTEHASQWSSHWSQSLEYSRKSLTPLLISGIKPRRCDRYSSGRTEELVEISTRSIEMVGISARIARRKELASAKEQDCRTKSTRSCWTCCLVSCHRKQGQNKIQLTSLTVTFGPDIWTPSIASSTWPISPLNAILACYLVRIMTTSSAFRKLSWLLANKDWNARLSRNHEKFETTTFASCPPAHAAMVLAHVTDATSH